MKCILKYCFGVLCLILFIQNLHSQINIKVAYDGQYLDLDNTNTAFSSFNKNNTLTTNYNDIHYLQGLDIGLRYMWGNMGFEAGWMNVQSAKNDAFSEDYDHNYKITSNSFYLGLESHIKAFGFGASLHSNKVKYLISIPDSRDRQTVISERILTPKFYIMATFKGDYTAISLRPYYIPSWKSFNLSPFNENLGVSGPALENFNGFGISVVLHNGPQ